MSFDKQYIKSLICKESYDELIDYCERYAAAGSAEAAATLAICLYEDPEKTDDFIKYATAAHEQGNSDGTLALALAYMDGCGTEKDENHAYELIAQAAGADNVWAMYMQGECLECGKGIEADIEAATALYTAAAKRGNKDAQRRIAKNYESGGDIKWCIAAAEIGIPDAEFDLAERYDEGREVLPDAEKAAELYKKCAERGNGKACLKLAKIYLSQRLAASALEMYRKAAEAGCKHGGPSIRLLESRAQRADKIYKKAQNGDLKAIYDYAVCLEQGDGRDKDTEEALRYYEKAAEADSKYALFKLGGIYQNGTLADTDIAKAVEYYKKAAQEPHGHSGAYYTLYLLYSQGEKVEKDEAYADECLLNAAQAGYSKAYYPAARLLEDKDICEAMKLYCKAEESNCAQAKERIASIIKDAHEGDAQAQYRLWLYHNYTCRGTGKTRSKAGKWLFESAKQGYEPALLQLMREDAEKAEFTAIEKETIRACSDNMSNSQKLYEVGCVYKSAALREKAEKLKECAYMFFSLAAKDDLAEAQYECALCLESGIGAEQNINEAFSMYLKAYENGSIAAQNHLGQCYLFGKGTEQDTKRALSCLRNAADSGDIEAEYYLSVYYETMEENPQLMLWHLKRAAQGGMAQAQYELAVHYEQGTCTELNQSEAVRWYKEAAENGYEDASRALAHCYENGIGTKKDLAKALELYPSMENDADAQLLLKFAYMYESGVGTELDLKRALDMYTKAAAQGSVEGLYNLGRFYEKGFGIKKNIKTALSYYIRAAEKGSAAAEYRLASYYSSGIYEPKDMNKAVELCLSAAEKGCNAAIYQLGRWYESGADGINRNIDTGLEYYRRAAENNYAPALYALAECYEQGNGAQRDVSDAFELYNKAADLNYPPAIFRMGVFYEAGYCVEQDISAAAEYFKKAYMLGYSPAKNKLYRLI